MFLREATAPGLSLPRWLPTRRSRALARAGSLAAAFVCLAGGAAVATGSSSAATAQQATPTTGVPSVGALFSVDAEGTLGSHFCTASVIDSAAKDLVVTAAHCLSGYQPDQVVFIPEYHSGIEPFGLWYATAFYVDKAWQDSEDPDDDFAFVAVRQAWSPQPLQDVTGGNKLGAGVRPPSPAPVLDVVGYPDGLDSPVDCASRLKLFSVTQLEFDCGGYTNGTSGSPFVLPAKTAGEAGTVVGVIGGYEQGGDTPSVSYAARFGATTRALYEAASRAAAAAARAAPAPGS